MRDIRKIRLHILFMMCIICVFFTIYFGYKILSWHKDNKNTEKIMEQIESVVTINIEGNSFNIAGLGRLNPDTVGWLRVENTKIDYPIVQTTNNEYYLKHSFDKSDNRAGWIFVDYRNTLDYNDKNIVIYGHNRKDESMFGTLKEALSKEIKIYLLLGNEIQKYEPFSVYTIKKENYYLSTNFDNDYEFEKYLKTVKDRSIKNFSVNVSTQDKILTLSTCANNNDYRVVVHAKRIVE